MASLFQFKRNGGALLSVPLCPSRGDGFFTRPKSTLALAQALEESKPHAAADADVLVLEHGLDDPQDGLWAQVVGAVKAIDGLEDASLLRPDIEGALLEAIVSTRSVLSRFVNQPFDGHLVKLGAPGRARPG